MNTNSPYRVILFDAGGVLFTDFFNKIPEYSKVLPKEITFDLIREAYNETDSPSWAKGIQTDDKVRWQEFVDYLKLPQEYVDICLDVFNHSYEPINETINYIKELKSKNPEIKIGILGEQPLSICNYIRENYKEIMDLFDPEYVFFSGENHLSKKDPEGLIYQNAIEKSHTNPEQILFVDNSMNNINNAKKFGLNVYYFDNDKEINSIINNLNQQIEGVSPRKIEKL